MLRRLVRPASRKAFSSAERRVRMANLADRLPHLSRRSENTVFWGLCVVLILLTTATPFILDRRARPTPSEPRNAAFVASSRAATRIDIPDVRGMPASDARAQLERAGLKFVGAEAAVGTPGQVLWTRPAIGRQVPSDTPVTIVVGVDAGRFVLETIGL
jgi:hypothetical protein